MPRKPKTDENGRIPLFMVREDADGAWWLASRPDYFRHSRPATEDEVTVAALTVLMDQEAEAANRHDFVGTHAGLAKILMDVVGPDATKAVIRRIFDKGGLPEL